ncbi:MAG: glucosamine-6-phosphate deaminase [Candidatus Brocadiaceae bacterium]
MQVLITSDYGQMSGLAARIVAGAVREKGDLVLGLATGSTPEGLYEGLIRAHREEGLDFSRVVTFNLDEYVGLGPDHPQSYRYFMNEKLFDHVNIRLENTHVPDGLAEPLSEHCAAYEQNIAEAGGIDLQVLGIGRDGHIGFNEPGTSLGGDTHVAALAEETVRDNARFFDSADEVPRLAVTMGVGTVMRARKCLLLASGESKADAVKAAIEGAVSAMVPASALQMHPATVAVLDEAAAAKLERLDFYRWQQRNLHGVSDRT